MNAAHQTAPDSLQPPDSASGSDLDARGLLCPEPLRLAELAMREMGESAVLRVHATDPAAPIDFEAWCLRRAHEFLSCEAVDEGWVIRVRKGAGSLAGTAPDASDE